ncbi:MAG: response regulator [Candidatus Rokubacteria bacterium]|nr:response regulator [Candidatus Rokubacteria bacterium]
MLVVDDEPLARDVLRDILEYCGALVLTVGSAHDALQTMRLIKPDLVVAKLALPDDDGFSLLRQLRTLVSEGPPLPAVAVSSVGADRERCLQHGFQAHFTWPLNPWEFTRTIAGLTMNG